VAIAIVMQSTRIAIEGDQNTLQMETDMPKKIKTIKLTDGIAPRKPDTLTTQAEWQAATRFRVEQITDSVEFHTGQLLERAEVQSLCASNDWKVTITSFKG
jgi:hypothetical protein